MLLSPADIAVFLAGTFAAAFVTSLSGFAFALIALAVWLYVLTPIQATPLIAGYVLLAQGYAVWKLRAKLDAARLAPFLIGSVAGVPLGIAALSVAPSPLLRMTVGALLVIFSAYSLLRPELPQVDRGGRPADAAVGLLNGVIGGATGIAGIAVVIWSGLRGWPRDEQRAVFQPIAVATFLFIALKLGGAGMVDLDVARLFLIGLPALALGTWAGWALYGRLDESAFRKVVLALLLVSGIGLLAVGR